MKILIVGNGFDLEHDLPTKYTEFLAQANLFRTGTENDSDIHDIIEKSEMRDEFCDIISTNAWLEYFIQCGKLTGDGWIDFEQEISNVIGNFDIQMAENDRIEITEKEELLSGLLKSFDCSDKDDALSGLRYKSSTTKITIRNPVVTRFSEFLYRELRRFVRAFEIYCVCIGCTTKTKSNRPLNRRDFDAVLSFNYTKTYEVLYGKKETPYCYIHGAAQSNPQNTNMVLGIDDTLGKENMNHAFTFAKFKKYFQRINLQTGSEYRDWVSGITNGRPLPNQGDSNIFIVGHSMGKTDLEVLREFFDLTKCGTLINIFFHNEIAKISLIERTIEIIGKENLIEQVHGRDRTIRFVDQYDATDGLFRK